MNTKHQYIQLLISIRLRQLHQEGFNGIQFNDLERIFSQFIFRRKKPRFLNELTDRILNISTDDVIRYLSLDAVANANQENLDDMITGVFDEN